MKLFIAMPYGTKSGILDINGASVSRDIPFDEVWNEFIKPAIPEDWEAVRTDESLSPGLINQKYMEDIYKSDVFIADITFCNPNVFYELGIRQAISKKGTVLIQQKGSFLPFDVQTQKVISYNLFMGTETRKFIDTLKQSLVMAATDTKGSPVHAFLPNLYVFESVDGENPNQIIKNLTKKIDDLRVEASTKLGSAEQFERQRTLRGELTDLLSRIVRAQVENYKLIKEHSSDPQFIQNVSSALSQENACLLNEAVGLIDQIPELVGAVEYNTIAYSMVNTGDFQSSEKYYVKAIDVSKSEIERSMSRRSYAMFLAQKGQKPESRAMFEQALLPPKSHDNQLYSLNGTTLQNWGMCELGITGNIQEANRLFDDAEKQFAAIDNPALKHQLLSTLTAIRNGAQPHSNRSSTEVFSRFQDFLNPTKHK